MTEHEIFVVAIKLSGQERRAFLDAACADAPELRQQVESLLRAHDESGSFLPKKVAGPEPDITRMLPGSPRPGMIIAGRYKLQEVIGEGGMGTVWMAEQAAPVKRRVALKLIKPGMDSRQVLARFDAERQALALMDHPNIAKVFDGGVTEEGHPYFVMEYVKGIPLTEYCDQARMSLRERLKLFGAVCQAVQHAHQKGIIHRDLKPSNILACLYDGQPVPKIIDFGLAKAMHQSLTDQSLFTAHGMMVGTPLYMSPEQAEHNNLDVDTRTDIYSLGVILYELLTGTTPLERLQFKDAAYNEILRLIKEVDPPRPSTRLSGSASLPSVAAQRSIEPAQLSKSLSGDLDWIVMKALDKERSRRYETANGLARDIDRFLSDEPVEACPPTTRYKIRKYVRRNRGKVLAASLIFAALMLGMVGTTWGFFQARHQAQIARNETAEKEIARQHEAERAEGERLAKLEALAAKTRAEKAEAETFDDYRASADDAIEQLIGSKPVLGPGEKKYLENTLKRWQNFADRQGDDRTSRTVRAESHVRIGQIWLRMGHKSEALSENRQASTIYEQLAADFPEDPNCRMMLVHCQDTWGRLADSLGRSAEAEKHYRLGNALSEQLVADFPDVPEYRLSQSINANNFGILYQNRGVQGEALKLFKSALVNQEKLSTEFPDEPEYRDVAANSRHNIAIVLGKLDQPDDARKQIEMAITIQKKLSDDFPDNVDYRFSLGRFHHTLANLLQLHGQDSESIASYRTALAIIDKLVAERPSFTDYRLLQSNIHSNLGRLMFTLGQVSEAEEQVRQAISIDTKLTTDFPDVAVYRNQAAMNHNLLGTNFKLQGRFSEAEEQQNKALVQCEALAKQFPDNLEFQTDLGGSYCNMGILIRDIGKHRESLEWFDKAIQTLTANDDPNHLSSDVREFLYNSYWARAQAHQKLEEYSEAASDWGKVVELSPPTKRLANRLTLVNLLYRAGRYAETAAEILSLTGSDASDIELENLDANQWYNFACICAVASKKSEAKQQEYSDHAMKLLRRSVQAGWTDVDHLEKDADLNALHPRDEYEKLVADLRAANAKSDQK